MKKQFVVEGMSCQHCVMAVMKELNKIDAKDFKVEIGLVEIDLSTNKVDEIEIKNAIEKAGYSVVETK